MDSSPSQSHTIKMLWPTIEPFLGVLSMVAVAQTCRELHRVIIDDATRRIKVSHLVQQPRAIDNRRGRIPNYLPLLLNSIHWPSLRSLYLSFVSVMPTRDDTTACFPLFVSQLGYAHNLERLHLDVGGVLKTPSDANDDGRNPASQPLIVLFGRNLARCTKLKDIDIFSNKEQCLFVAKELVLALTPVLTKQRDVLNRIRFVSWPQNSQSGNENDRNILLPAATDFFRAILSCPSLRKLQLVIPHMTLTDALVAAAGRKMSTFSNKTSKRQKLRETGERRLRYLYLMLSGSHIKDMEERKQTEYLECAKTMLEDLTGGTELETFMLTLPRQIWEAYSGALADVLNRHMKLSRVDMTFRVFGENGDGLSRDSGKILELLIRRCLGRDGRRIDELRLEELNNVDGKLLLKLLEEVRSAGGAVDSYDIYNSLDRDDAYSSIGDKKNLFTSPAEDMPMHVDIDRIRVCMDMKNYDGGEWI